jgi:molybdopterin-containing oxidoreductase family membrane subunit
MVVLRRLGGVKLPDKPMDTLVKIVRVTILINLLMVISELFTEFYSGGAHTSSARYLFFGHGEANALVPWIWTAIAFNVLAAFLFMLPRLVQRTGLLVAACAMAFVGAWIEKGMGLIVPGFVPSTLHEYVEYLPSHLEWRVAAGVIAFGLLVYSAGLKIAIPIFRGTMRFQPESAAPAETSSEA